MRIILNEDVANLGRLGEVVEARKGYARNFLIPRGKAERATADAVTAFAKRRTELEKVQKVRAAKIKETADTLDGYLLQLPMRAAADGRLYGSVTAATIVESLAEQGFEVQKGQITIPDGSIKEVGEHRVAISLGAELASSLRVSVLAEGAAPIPAEAAVAAESATAESDGESQKEKE